MEPTVTISKMGQICYRQLSFAKTGDTHAGHRHSYDHATLLAHGKLAVTVEGSRYEFTAPHIITIQKQRVHDLEALQDGTVAYCVALLADVVTEP